MMPLGEARASRRFCVRGSGIAGELLVAAAIGWNLVSLRAETLAVSYGDDSSVHEQMVRFATAQLRLGHLPMTRWFPDLGLGSPQFLHYQSLPATLAGAIGLAVGPDAAFRWTLYLLLSLWPLAVYLGARLLGISRGAAGAAGAMSPFLASVPGVGYEQNAYAWIGYGVWTQLWASLTLPLAWGFSWRAIRHGASLFPAVVAIGLTLALHFETGYLAVAPLLLWPFIAGPPVGARVRRATLVLVGSLLCSAWAIVPVIANSNWAAQNEPLRGTALTNGYGALQILGWLVSGQLLDNGRLPVVTVFALVGIGLACARWVDNPDRRAVLVALLVSMILSFGRATLGPLVDIVPGSGDLFFRRFMMGSQLALLLLAGLGAAACLRGARKLGLGWHPRGARVARGPGIACVATIVVLAPAWSELGAYDRRNSAEIHAQRTADRGLGRQLDRLLTVIARRGGGRAYAGMPSNWGESFHVGAVPVFKYIENRDVDEVGYTLRTASLMTNPEYYFDDRNAGDYALFGIRYLVMSCEGEPPVSAPLLARAGPYCVRTVGSGGYLHVGKVVGRVTADRTNLGKRTSALLTPPRVDGGRYLKVDFGATGPPRPVAVDGGRVASTGRIVDAVVNLNAGWAGAEVNMQRTGVVVLSASFDPGWAAQVDGRREATEMVAPALVAVRVPSGTHHVVFVYSGYPAYTELFAICGASLLAFVIAPLVRRVRLQTRP